LTLRNLPKRERERDCFIFIEQTNETYFINCLQIGLVRHVDSSGLDLFFEKAKVKTQYNQERDTSFQKKKKEKQDQENTIQEISFISKSILLQFARQCV